MHKLLAYDLYGFDPTLIDMDKVDRFHDRATKTLKAQGKSKEKHKPVLRTTIDATRSGCIVNTRCYVGASVNAAIPTWLKPHPLAVLTHHRQADSVYSNVKAEDPIGRVFAAKFVPFSGADLRNDFVHAAQGGKGSGQVILTVDIQDKDAQQKILDKRYLTVSTSQGISDAHCSICGQSVRNHCDHRPGRTYALEETSPLYRHLVKTIDAAKKSKKKKEIFAVCFDVWDGEMVYREVSFVNIPAQKFAGVLSHEFVEDSDEESDPTKGYDVYDGSWDHPGIVSICYTDGVTVQELFTDSITHRTPSGLFVSAPRLQMPEEDTSMNTGGVGQDASQEPVTPKNEQDHNITEEGTTVDNTELQKQIDTLTKDVSGLKKSLEAVTGERDGLKQDTEKLTETNDELTKKLVGSLANTLFNMRQVAGVTPADISEEDTKTTMDKFSKRSPESLSDAIEDLRPRFQSALKVLQEKDQADEENADDAEGDDDTEVDPDVQDAAGTVQNPTAQSAQDTDSQSSKPKSVAEVLGFAKR